MGELRADMNFRPIRESRADEMGSDLKPLYMKEGAGRNRPAHVAEAVGRLKRPASSGYGLSMTAVRQRTLVRRGSPRCGRGDP